ncbi:cupin domain-containing protein [Rossellomorea sp. NS-SX7]|uniref:cupin domain-containing protein n=1 Tax=Rossellomorea sp. NS-SX7 TaxID=3463856 RepID=UPI004059B119
MTDVDYSSPSAQFSANVNRYNLFTKDRYNLINILGKKQLNTLENTSLLDIFLSRGNIVEPHYHQNAAELVYCISGKVTVSILNPFTREVTDYPATPGEVVNIPQGWWHYEVADVDNTHLLAIFDAPNPEVILGSDILTFTPSNIMAKTYCMNENQWNNVISNVKPATYIGPPADCRFTVNPHHLFHQPHEQYIPYQYRPFPFY